MAKEIKKKTTIGLFPDTKERVLPLLLDQPEHKKKDMGELVEYLLIKEAKRLKIPVTE